MYSFLNDYSEGCHPDILTALSQHNLSQQSGYGADDYSETARQLLWEKLGTTTPAIHFVTAGTQANLLCIAAALKPFEAVIAADSGHIAANEAGAIEATGHKIITMPNDNGKLTVAAIEKALAQFALHPHMVRPKLVYISNATELGTVYTRQELQALSACCKSNQLYLLLDGARLGVALASRYNDVSFADLAEMTDIFWLGGTKMGALFGEAIIINSPDLQTDFAFHLKQRGALLAKSRVLGLQFATLLNNGLYLSLSRHANEMAQRLAQGLADKGFQTTARVESNQLFVVLPQKQLPTLSQYFSFYEWEKGDNDTCIVRLVTSWATDATQVQAFIDHVIPSNSY